MLKKTPQKYFMKLYRAQNIPLTLYTKIFKT